MVPVGGPWSVNEGNDNCDLLLPFFIKTGIKKSIISIENGEGGSGCIIPPLYQKRKERLGFICFLLALLWD